MQRVKHNENKTIVEMTPFSIEKYTYFYINLNTMVCSVIYNSALPDFKKSFSAFLNDIKDQSNFTTYAVINVIDTDFEFKLNHFNEILKLTVIAKGNHNDNLQMVNLKDAFHISNENIISSNISVILKNEPLNEKAKKALLEDPGLLNRFEKITIKGRNEKGVEETIEAINRYLRKKVVIDLDNEMLEGPDDLDKVMDALKNAFQPT